MEREQNEKQGGPQLEAVQPVTSSQRPVELGSVGIHSRAAECLLFADVHQAVRRHQAGETQPGLSESLCKLAETESAATGLVISYHIASNSFVFGVVTNRIAEKTFVELAPLNNLDDLASWGADAMNDEVYV